MNENKQEKVLHVAVVIFFTAGLWHASFTSIMCTLCHNFTIKRFFSEVKYSWGNNNNNCDLNSDQNILKRSFCISAVMC